MQNNNALEIIEPSDRAFESVRKTATEFLDQAKTYAAGIIDAESFRLATEFYKSLKKMKRDATEQCEPLRKKAYDTYQEVLKQRDAAVSPLDEAMLVLDAPILKWQNEQNRLRKIEEEKASAAAKRAAEEAQIKAAEAAQASGNAAKANAILAQPIAQPAVKIPEPAETVSVRGTWTVEDDDVVFDEFVNGVIAGKIPRAALKIDMVFVRGQAKLMKGKLDWPGCTPKFKQTIL